MGEVLNFISNEKGERGRIVCIGSARFNHFTNPELSTPFPVRLLFIIFISYSIVLLHFKCKLQANDCSKSSRPVSTPDNTNGSPPTLTQFSPTAFEAELNHSHLLVLDDGTNWTAPGLELEFRTRLEALLENGFKQDEPCALTVPDLLIAGPAVEETTTNFREANFESLCGNEDDENFDEEEERFQQLAHAMEVTHGSQPSLTKPVCVLVIGGSFGTLSNIKLICVFYLLDICTLNLWYYLCLQTWTKQNT